MLSSCPRRLLRELIYVSTKSNTSNPHNRPFTLDDSCSDSCPKLNMFKKTCLIEQPTGDRRGDRFS